MIASVSVRVWDVRICVCSALWNCTVMVNMLSSFDFARYAGINFGDGYGRCVMVLGLPYPDLRDPELNERLLHADRLAADGRYPGSGGACSEGDSRLGSAGRAMYTNLCMQAVNQCVGRAIRHARDYAAVVLVDVRYTTGDGSGQALRAKLPHWVTRRWRDCPDAFGPAMAALAQFFQQVSHT